MNLPDLTTFAGDPKAWAKRIIDQHAANPRSVRPISLRFAREALGIKPQVKEQQQ